jgi:hypothetical protein
LTWNIFILFFCIFCIFIAFFAFFAFLSHFIAFLLHFPHFYRIFHIFIAFFVFLSHFSNFSHFYFKTLKSINLRFFTPFFCNAPKFTPFFVPHRGKFTPGQSRFYDGKFTAVNSKKRSKSVNWSKSLMLSVNTSNIVPENFTGASYQTRPIWN